MPPLGKICGERGDGVIFGVGGIVEAIVINNEHVYAACRY